MKSWSERAVKVFPGGISNGEFGLPPDKIVVITRGQGCRLWDSEDREYLDFSMGWGSCLVGHANPEVVEAVCEQVPLGSNFAYLNPHALAVAEEITRIAPAAERLRFCASGTEANIYCQRLAKAFTGKAKLLKFEGAYHGANEPGVTSLFPTKFLDFPEPELTSAGTPMAKHDLLVAPYNDLVTTRQIVAQHANDLAAIIMEPLQRCTPPKEGYLEGVRALCDEYGLLLVFDEVVTGFRLAYGGAQEYYGVIPDLVAYGKALGGGYPIGAVAGRTDIMDWLREDRIGSEDYVWMASTLGGNPVSMAAANAVLKVLRQPGTYQRLHTMGAYFRDSLARVLRDRQIQGQIIGDGPLAQIVFSPDPVDDYRSTAKGDKKMGRRMMLGLFERGVFLNPMGTKLYLSIAHDEDACDEFCRRLDTVLAELGDGRLKR
ncbi:MAG: aspartate aminotransferase family protein [Chloroflexi bacterium]|nr:aspartate aminotransferase family protein [Chloroflexota bacterium]